MRRPTDESMLLHPVSVPDAPMPVPTLLREARPRRAYLLEMPGNHGDKLSYLGAMTILQELNIRRTFDPRRADYFLMLGQATITDIWGSGVPALRHLFERFPNTPVIVLPSSFHFTETDFSSVFVGRTARCVLIARDTMSWDVLKSCDFPDSVETYCDHDLAFYLQHSKLIGRLQRMAETQNEDYVMVVERHDREHHGESGAARRRQNPEMPNPFRLAMKTYFWAPKQALRRLVRPEPRHEELSVEFRAECERVIAEDIPWAHGLPWTIGDLSSSGQYSFREFCSFIARARAVLTSRLHVGILAAMLGKPTFLRAGRYAKLPGVYEMSMSDWPNVKLFGPEGGVED